MTTTTRHRVSLADPARGGAGARPPLTRGALIHRAGSLAFMAAACAPAGQGEPGGTAPVKGPVSVRLATDWLSGPRGDTLSMAIPAFQQRHPDITVQVDAITGEYFTAINTQLAAGTIQEVVLLEGNFFQSYKDQGAFTAIDAALKRQNVGMADYTVVPGIYQDKGRQYGMPFQLVVSGWYYNADLFRDRGLRLPDDSWTWDDVLAAAQALTQPEKGQYGIHVTNSDQFC